MTMTTEANLLLIQMGSDERIPASALGYVDDLGRECSPQVLADRLRMLARYAPDLVDEFQKAST
jgi:hypothetical protein